MVARVIKHLQAPPVPRHVEPTLLRFYADQAREWLVREMPGPAWDYALRGNRITFDRRYQLRFDSDQCRWQLFHGSPRSWAVTPLRGPCLSLVDWLRQIRHRENRASSRIES